MSSMFCFQCEQTAGGQGCRGNRGVCGKSETTANLQDSLTSSLIDLAQKAESSTGKYDRLILDGLFATLTNVNFNDDSIKELLERVRAVGAEGPGHLDSLWGANEDIRSVKSLILFGIRGIAAYAHHAVVLGYVDSEVNVFLRTALKAVGDETLCLSELLPLVMETGRINFKVMELLDKANTTTYGTPVPTQVNLGVEKGPFIVVSGHDLKDLKLLLEQTEGRGINIYTHGEMLPAHAYPVLKKYAHLKGNFGTAWQNQVKEFENIPGAILFTTNCLMPVKSYGDRVFTTAAVDYPGIVHIGEDRDFSSVIKKALELGGNPGDVGQTGINGGTRLLTGFGHQAVLSAAETVVGAVKSGAIRHFFLVGGCDGAKAGRNYYTDFVREAPADTIILTLACGKYRFNDLDLGEIGGLPRLLDMGQCNDAYSAIKVAVALSEAFGCSVNELPLTLVLSWYEQKAVSILLTLLYLGIKNILLGPSLPAFVSPTVLKHLVDNFNLTPIGKASEDLARILSK